MPKGKGKGKKKKEGKGGKKKKEEGTDNEEKDQEKKDFGPPPPSDKEQALREELYELDNELDTLKKQVDQLKLENEWLQEESEKTKLENQDYQTYISRRAQKRQSLIVSLSDQNRVELQEIEQQKEDLLKDFEEKKSELNATLLEKQNELARVNQELQALEPFRALQRQQENEISQLEKEVDEKRFQHENRIRVLKTQFLQEQRQFEHEAELRVHAMAEKADKRASQCLTEQTRRISVENRQLRIHLQELIENTNGLQFQKKQLEKQYQKLLQEHQFNLELRKLKGLPMSGSFDSNSDLNLTTTHVSTLPQITRK